MKRAKGAALVVFAALMFVPMTTASAHDTYDDRVPLMVPNDGEGPMDVAVYFGDNLAFTPQWRLGNFIRIEIMILDADCDSPSDILLSDTDVYNQTELRADPNLLYDTNMISVSEIWVNITSETGEVVVTWHSDFTKDVSDGEDRTVIREINGEGHLIYGGKWDTGNATNPAEPTTPGNYTVSVDLPGIYNVKWALQHDRGVEEEPVEDVALLSDDPVEDPAEAIGYMNVTDGGVDLVTNEGYIVLGELLDGGGGGSNSGGDGVSGGNGPAYQGGGARRR